MSLMRCCNCRIWAALFAGSETDVAAMDSGLSYPCSCTALTDSTHACVIFHFSGVTTVATGGLLLASVAWLIRGSPARSWCSAVGAGGGKGGLDAVAPAVLSSHDVDMQFHHVPAFSTCRGPPVAKILVCRRGCCGNAAQIHCLRHLVAWPHRHGREWIHYRPQRKLLHSINALHRW